MFSRLTPGVQQVVVSETTLPTRGSDHPAFTEMLFLWHAQHEMDPKFRSVYLPSGFSLLKIEESRWEIRDRDGFPRAVVHAPNARGSVPSISPLRRFSCNAEPHHDEYRGFVSDWGSIVYRTGSRKTQADALCMAKKWLDDNKPRWDSYTSAVNFERRPAR
jgi:hypothetical protein